MFSKLRKLVSKDDEPRKGGDGDGCAVNGNRALEPQLQRKFGRGVQYNMKIVIRGDKNVGKSCLFLRLQGLPFKEEYMPSEEIQVANIQWNFKASDDIVKVEIWDVVDKSKKRRTLSGLKLNNSSAAGGDAANGQDADTEVGLDAETLDVYKGTHGVILMMDLTKVWTFDYVKREVDRVPLQLPVLILVNHRDMGHHQTTTVNLDQVRSFVFHLERPATASAVIVAESSMRNGFGLKYLHKFLNLPFLQLQREALDMQLEQNKLDTNTTHQELESLLESEEQNYDLFIQALSDTRRKAADKLTPNVPVVQPAAGSSVPPPASPRRLDAPPAHLPLNGKMDLPKVESTSSGFFAKKSAVPQSSASAPTISASQVPPTRPAAPARVQHIDEFIPDDNAHAEFLDEPVSAAVPSAASKPSGGKMDFGSSDEEEDGGNPMVAGFTDEIELDQIAIVEYPPPLSKSAVFLNDRVTKNEMNSNLPSPQMKEAQSEPPGSGIVIKDSFSLENEEDNHQSPSDEHPSLAFETFSSVTHQLASPVQFNPDEFSSWLTDVEKRDIEKVAVARKYSAGLVTATSLDDSRVEGRAVDEPQDESIKKKSKKKTGAKKKADKSSKKTVDPVAEKPAPVSSVKKPVPMVRRELSEADQHKVLERELEDFLASDDE